MAPSALSNFDESDDLSLDLELNPDLSNLESELTRVSKRTIPIRVVDSQQQSKSESTDKVSKAIEKGLAKGGSRAGAITGLVQGATQAIGQEFFSGFSQSSRGAIRALGTAVDKLQSDLQKKAKSAGLRASGFADEEDLKQSFQSVDYRKIFIDPLRVARKEAYEESIKTAAEGGNAAKKFVEVFKTQVIKSFDNSKDIQRLKFGAFGRAVAGASNVAAPVQNIRRDINIQKAKNQAKNIDVEFNDQELESIRKAKKQIVVGNPGYYLFDQGKSGEVLGASTRRFLGQEFVGLNNPSAVNFLKGEELPDQARQVLQSEKTIKYFKSIAGIARKLNLGIADQLESIQSGDDLERLLIDKLSSIEDIDLKRFLLSALESALGGTNFDLPDQIARVQKIQALRPDLEVKSLGFSGGGFYSDQLSRGLGIKSVALGTPFFQQPQAFSGRGTKDAIYDSYGKNNFLRNIQGSNFVDLQGAGALHAPGAYFGNAGTRKFINDKLDLGLSEESLKTQGLSYFQSQSNNTDKEIRKTVQALVEVAETANYVAGLGKLIESQDFSQSSPEELKQAFSGLFEAIDVSLQDFIKTVNAEDVDLGRDRLTGITDAYRNEIEKLYDQPQRVVELFGQYVSEFNKVANQTLTTGFKQESPLPEKIQPSRKEVLTEELSAKERLLIDLQYRDAQKALIDIKKQEVQAIKAELAQLDKQDATPVTSQSVSLDDYFKSVEVEIVDTRNGFQKLTGSITDTERRFLDFLSGGKGQATKEAFQRFGIDRTREAVPKVLSGVGTALRGGYGALSGTERAVLGAVPKGLGFVAKGAIQAGATFAGVNAIAPGVGDLITGVGSGGGSAIGTEIGQSITSYLVANTPAFTTPIVNAIGTGITSLLGVSGGALGSGAAALGAGAVISSVGGKALQAATPQPLRQALALPEAKQAEKVLAAASENIVNETIASTQKQAKALLSAPIPVEVEISPISDAIGQLKPQQPKALLPQVNESIVTPSVKLGAKPSDVSPSGAIARAKVLTEEVKSAKIALTGLLQDPALKTGRVDLLYNAAIAATLLIDKAQRAKDELRELSNTTGKKGSFEEQQSVTGSMGGVVKNAKQAQDFLRNLIKGFEKTGRDSGRFYELGIAAGMSPQEAEQAAEKLTAAIILATEQGLEIKSPSRVGKRIGAFFVQGVTIGLNPKEAKIAADKLADTIASISDRFTALPIPSGLKQYGKNLIEEIQQGVTEQQVKLGQQVRGRAIIAKPFTGKDSAVKFTPQTTVGQAQKQADKLGLEYQKTTKAIESFPFAQKKPLFTPFSGIDDAIEYDARTAVGKLQAEAKRIGLEYKKTAQVVESFPVQLPKPKLFTPFTESFRGYSYTGDTPVGDLKKKIAERGDSYGAKVPVKESFPRASKELFTEFKIDEEKSKQSAEKAIDSILSYLSFNPLIAQILPFIPVKALNKAKDVISTVFSNFVAPVAIKIADGSALTAIKQQIPTLLKALPSFAIALIGTIATVKLTDRAKEAIQKQFNFEASISGLSKEQRGVVRKQSEDLSKFGVDRQILAARQGQFADIATGQGLSEDFFNKTIGDFLKAARTQGLSADQADRGLTTLGQILDKGKIYAEEVQQLNEAIPGSRGLIAKSLGVRADQLEQTVQAGGVDVNRFAPKFVRNLAARPRDVDASQNPEIADQRFSYAVDKISAQSAGGLVTGLIKAKNVFADLSDQSQAFVGILSAATTAAVVFSVVATGKVVASLVAATGAATLFGNAVKFAVSKVPLLLALAAAATLVTAAFDTSAGDNTNQIDRLKAEIDANEKLAEAIRRRKAADKGEEPKDKENLLGSGTERLFAGNIKGSLADFNAALARAVNQPFNGKLTEKSTFLVNQKGQRIDDDQLLSSNQRNRKAERDKAFQLIDSKDFKDTLKESDALIKKGQSQGLSREDANAKTELEERLRSGLSTLQQTDKSILAEEPKLKAALSNLEGVVNTISGEILERNLQNAITALALSLRSGARELSSATAQAGLDIAKAGVGRKLGDGEAAQLELDKTRPSLQSQADFLSRDAGLQRQKLAQSTLAEGSEAREALKDKIAETEQKSIDNLTKIASLEAQIADAQRQQLLNAQEAVNQRKAQTIAFNKDFESATLDEFAASRPNLPQSFVGLQQVDIDKRDLGRRKGDVERRIKENRDNLRSGTVSSQEAEQKELGLIAEKQQLINEGVILESRERSANIKVVIEQAQIMQEVKALALEQYKIEQDLRRETMATTEAIAQRAADLEGKRIEVKFDINDGINKIKEYGKQIKLASLDVFKNISENLEKVGSKNFKAIANQLRNAGASSRDIQSVIRPVTRGPRTPEKQALTEANLLYRIEQERIATQIKLFDLKKLSLDAELNKQQELLKIEEKKARLANQKSIDEALLNKQLAEKDVAAAGDREAFARKTGDIRGVLQAQSDAQKAGTEGQKADLQLNQALKERSFLDEEFGLKRKSLKAQETVQKVQISVEGFQLSDQIGKSITDIAEKVVIGKPGKGVDATGIKDLDYSRLNKLIEQSRRFELSLPKAEGALLPNSKLQGAGGFVQLPGQQGKTVTFGDINVTVEGGSNANGTEIGVKILETLKAYDKGLRSN